MLLREFGAVAATVGSRWMIWLTGTPLVAADTDCTGGLLTLWGGGRQLRGRLEQGEERERLLNNGFSFVGKITELC